LKICGPQKYWTEIIKRKRIKKVTGTFKKVGKKLIHKINVARGNVIGAVINRAEYHKLSYQAYSYYSQYQKYYSPTS